MYHGQWDPSPREPRYKRDSPNQPHSQLLKRTLEYGLEASQGRVVILYLRGGRKGGEKGEEERKEEKQGAKERSKGEKEGIRRRETEGIH